MSSGFMGLHAVVLLIFVIHHGSRGRMCRHMQGYTVLHHLKPRCNERAVCPVWLDTWTLWFCPLVGGSHLGANKSLSTLMLLYPECHSDCAWVWNYGREDKVRSLSALQASAPSRRDSVDADLSFWCALLVLKHTPHTPCKMGWEWYWCQDSQSKVFQLWKHFSRDTHPHGDCSSDRLGQ